MKKGDNIWYERQCINDDRVFEQNRMDCCKNENVSTSEERRVQCSSMLFTNATYTPGDRERIIDQYNRRSSRRESRQKRRYTQPYSLPIQSDPDSIMDLQLFAETPQPQHTQVDRALFRELLTTEYTFKKDLELLTHILVKKPDKKPKSTWPSTQKARNISSQQNDTIEDFIDQLATVTIELSENSEKFMKDLINDKQLSKFEQMYKEYITYIENTNKPQLPSSIHVLEQIYAYVEQYLKHGVAFLLLIQSIGDSNLITFFQRHHSFLKEMDIHISERDFINKLIQPSLRITRVGIDIVQKLVKSLSKGDHVTEERDRASNIQLKIGALCDSFHDRFASLTDFKNECTLLKSSDPMDPKDKLSKKNDKCSKAINKVFS